MICAGKYNDTLHEINKLETLLFLIDNWLEMAIIFNFFFYCDSAEEQGVLNDTEHHRAIGDWRRPRSESGGVDDMETTYVPADACLPGPHRRHCVNIE